MLAPRCRAAIRALRRLREKERERERERERGWSFGGPDQDQAKELSPGRPLRVLCSPSSRRRQRSLLPRPFLMKGGAFRVRREHRQSVLEKVKPR